MVAVLAADGVDAEAALRDGRLAVLPLEDFYRPDGQHALVERSLSEGFSAVRMSVEVDAALRMLLPSAYPAIEQHVAELVRTLPVSAMCQYSQSATTGPWLEVTVEDHLTGVRQATFSTGPDPQGLVLRGELEIANHDVISAVVCAAVARAPQVLRLDLAEVTFIDVASCRQFAELTREFRAVGGQLLLVAPKPAVERLLRLVRIDAHPGISVVET